MPERTAPTDMSVSQLRANFEDLQVRYKELLNQTQLISTPPAVQHFNTLYKMIFSYINSLKVLKLDSAQEQQINQLNQELERSKTMDELLELENQLNAFSIGCVRGFLLGAKSVPHTSEARYYQIRRMIETQQQRSSPDVRHFFERLEQVQKLLGLTFPQRDETPQFWIRTAAEELDDIITALRAK